MRAKITINDESDKVDDIRANNKEVENGDFLTISKIVEQKQIFEKRLKYRKVKTDVGKNWILDRCVECFRAHYSIMIRISWSQVMKSQHSPRQKKCTGRL